jgi:hypothetical protein
MDGLYVRKNVKSSYKIELVCKAIIFQIWLYCSLQLVLPIWSRYRKIASINARY